MMMVDSTAAAEIFRSKPDRFIDVGVGEVAYRRIGTGPDVLFVHGWPVSGATYRTLLPHLVDDATCHIIDLPGTGSSRFASNAPLRVSSHIESVRRVVDQLGLDSVAVVGHDSGGLIARHAMAGDERLRSMGLIDTEPECGLGWRLKALLKAAKLPAVGVALRWVCGQPGIRRRELAFGSAFADPSLVDGEFAEFFLDPLHQDSERLAASVKLLKSFDMQLVDDLTELHRKIDVPVKLVWGEKDPFFPVSDAEAMVDTFPNASLDVIAGAGLFSHEERPKEVADALRSTLIASA